MKISHLTSAEEQLMILFWKLNSFYMKDVMDQLPEPKPHQNTVSTYLKILVEKGFLKIEKEGRIFKYLVDVPINEYRKFLLQNFIQSYCNNSGKELLKTLLEEGIIKTSDLDLFNNEKTSKASTTPKVKKELKEEQISDFIDEITSDKKSKKKKGKKKDKKNGKKKK